MTLLSFPDVNVWLALASHDHVHSARARLWWQECSGTIVMVRSTQHGFLRLVTTSSAMNGKPLGMTEAWQAYDRFYEDYRVVFLAEPPEVEKIFREFAIGKTASPKLWTDAWLLAVAEAAGGRLITLDKALDARDAFCLL